MEMDCDFKKMSMGFRGGILSVVVDFYSMAVDFYSVAVDFYSAAVDSPLAGSWP